MGQESDILSSDPRVVLDSVSDGLIRFDDDLTLLEMRIH